MTINELEIEIKKCEANIDTYKLEIDKLKQHNFYRNKIKFFLSKINNEKETIIKHRTDILSLKDAIYISPGVYINTMSTYIVHTPTVNETVNISVLENYESIPIDVIDDIFESGSNRYYVMTTYNNIIYINNILNIEKETNKKNKSFLYKWFIEKERNYFRSKKLNNII